MSKPAVNIAHRIRLIESLLMLSAVSTIVGCHGASHPPATEREPTTRPVSASPPQAEASSGALASYSDSSAGIAFKYPSSWKQTKGATAVLTVVAPPAEAGGGFAALFLDLPKVPPFAGLLVSVKAVADGYVDDVKKHRIADAQVDSKDVTVAGAAAKDVTVSGKETGSGPGLPPAGSPATEEAVTIVRSAKIYIFSCDSNPAGTPAAHAALEAAVGSVQWSH
jgi:hypothetical protein